VIDIHHDAGTRAEVLAQVVRLYLELRHEALPRTKALQTLSLQGTACPPSASPRIADPGPARQGGRAWPRRTRLLGRRAPRQLTWWRRGEGRPAIGYLGRPSADVRLEASLQLSVSRDATMMTGPGDQEALRLHFDVLTKTSQPELHRYWTQRDRAATRGLFRLVSAVLRAIEAGAFHPIPGWRCKDCPFRSRCWAWA